MAAGDRPRLCDRLRAAAARGRGRAWGPGCDRSPVVACWIDAMTTLTTVCASEFILLDHHPDLSRWPEARPGLVEAENRRAALTWNVFRTLELIAPTFWLRR